MSGNESWQVKATFFEQVHVALRLAKITSKAGSVQYLVHQVKLVAQERPNGSYFSIFAYLFELR